MSTGEKVFWYLASSYHMFDHEKYEEIRRIHIPRALKVVSPEKENRIIVAKGLYADSHDWKAKWPLLLQQKLNGGIFFIRDGGDYIGKGVFTEITGALEKGLRVFLMLYDGRWAQLSALADVEDKYAFAEGPSWNQYRHVVTGDCSACSTLGILTMCVNCEKRFCCACWGSCKDTTVFPGVHYCSPCAVALAPDDDQPF